MIQRIQSLWLLVAAILAILTFKFPFYTGTWLQGATQHPQLSFVAYTPSVLVLVATTITIVLSLVTIFMYKSRKQQLLLTVLNLLVSLMLIYLYYNEIKTHFLSGGTLAFWSIFTFAIPVFLVLAMNGIRKDMRLLKSADRLRN